MRKKTLQAIRDHGVAAYPLECCGLVLKAGRREWYQPCRNTAASAEHFVMSAEDYAAAEESGDIVAVVHSHPDAPAAPSEADRVACEASGLPWYIVAVESPRTAMLSPARSVASRPKATGRRCWAASSRTACWTATRWCATGTRASAISSCPIFRATTVGGNPASRATCTWTTTPKPAFAPAGR